MWFNPDVVGLFSFNVVSFSSNVVLRGLLFSLNSVPKPPMLSVRADYVLSSLHIALVAELGRGEQFGKVAGLPSPRVLSMIYHQHVCPGRSGQRRRQDERRGRSIEQRSQFCAGSVVKRACVRGSTLGDALTGLICRGENKPDASAGVLRTPGLGNKGVGLPGGIADLLAHSPFVGGASGQKEEQGSNRKCEKATSFQERAKEWCLHGERAMRAIPRRTKIRGVMAL